MKWNFWPCETVLWHSEFPQVGLSSIFLWRTCQIINDTVKCDLYLYHWCNSHVLHKEETLDSQLYLFLIKLWIAIGVITISLSVSNGNFALRFPTESFKYRSNARSHSSVKNVDNVSHSSVKNVDN